MLWAGRPRSPYYRDIRQQKEREKKKDGIWQRIWKATREDEDDEDDDDDEEYDDDEKEANRVHGLARSARRSHDDADMT